MALVVDASAYTTAITEHGDRADRFRAAMARDGHWIVPEHFMMEAGNAFRGLRLSGQVDDAGPDGAMARLVASSFDIWPSRPLLPRVRQLAANATSYDAAYIALAEELGCSLLTADRELGRVPGIRCAVITH